MNTLNTTFYDDSFNYQEHKLKLIKELKEIEDRIVDGKSTNYYSFLKQELESDLSYVNQVINEYYYR